MKLYLLIILKFIFKQLKTQNMMKKILQLVVVLIITAQGVMAQSVSIANDTYVPGEITVQVDMVISNEIGSISLNIEFDADLMSFVGIDDTQLSGSWIANQTGNIVAIRYIKSGAGSSISGKLLDMLFAYKGGFSSDLIFDEANCEVTDDNLGVITPITYTDGMVQQNTTGAMAVSMPTNLVATIGNTVDVPVTLVDGDIYAVEAITLKVAYNENALAFAGIIDGAITGAVANANDGVVTINWTGTESFIATTDLLDVQFVYNGGNAVMEFIPGCEFASTTALPVTYTDGMITATPGTASLSLSTAVGTGTTFEEVEVVNVPVMAADFGSDVLGAITMEVSYDNSLMSFTGITEQQLNGWVVNGTTDGEITLNWSAVGGGTLSDGSMMTLNFVFGESAGEAEIFFEPGSIVKDINLDPYPISFNDGIIIPTFTVSGQLTYFGVAARPMFNSTVYLKNAGDNSIAFTTATDATGNYSFAEVVNGTYYLDGASAIDATQAYDLIDAYYIYGVGGTLTGLQALAADVNEIGGVDIVDAYIVYGSYGGGTYVKVGAWTAADWFFDNTAVTVNDAAVSQDFGAIASGDANASFVPAP